MMDMKGNTGIKPNNMQNQKLLSKYFQGQGLRLSA